jgi:hypothetical protein
MEGMKGTEYFGIQIAINRMLPILDGTAINAGRRVVEIVNAEMDK